MWRKLKGMSSFIRSSLGIDVLAADAVWSHAWTAAIRHCHLTKTENLLWMHKRVSAVIYAYLSVLKKQYAHPEKPWEENEYCFRPRVFLDNCDRMKKIRSATSFSSSDRLKYKLRRTFYLIADTRIIKYSQKWFEICIGAEVLSHCYAELSAYCIKVYPNAVVICLWYCKDGINIIILSFSNIFIRFLHYIFCFL